MLFVATAAAAFLVYAQSIRNEFVWDDPIVIGQQLPAFHSVSEIFFPPPKIPQFGRLYYRPMIILSYVLDRELWKDPRFGFHFPVVLYHALNTGLIFLVGRRLFGRTYRCLLAALAAALLFAVHPIHTESICWMAGRSDSLAALFLLPSFLAYLGWRRQPSRYVLLLLAAVLFFGGCLTKESALGMLLVLAAADLLGIRGIGEKQQVAPLPGSAATAAGSQQRSDRKGRSAKRAPGASRGRGGRQAGPLGRRSAATGRLGTGALLGGWAAMGAAALVYFMLRKAALRAEATPLQLQQADPVVSFLNLMRAIGFYLSKLFAPVHLDAYIPEIPSPGLNLAIGLLGVAASLALARLAWKRGEPLVVLLIAWFYGTLAPSLAIAVFTISEAPVAERYLYTPSAALCLAAGYLGVMKLPSLVSAARRAAVLASAGLVIVGVSVAYGWGTLQRAKVWETDLAFWKDTVAKSPDEGLPHLHLGLAYANLNQNDLAEQEYLTAIRVKYDDEGRSIALNNLGMLYMGRREYDKAEEFFEKSIRTRPDYATPHYGIGVTSLRRAEEIYKRGQFAEASPIFRRSEQYLRRAIELNPQYVKAHNQLGYLLINSGRIPEGVKHLDTVLRLARSGSEHDFAASLKQQLAAKSQGLQQEPPASPGDESVP